MLYDVSVASSAGVERVLFMNDIIYCAADILEILYGNDAQRASRAKRHPAAAPRRPRRPCAAFPQLAPFQVLSCWNGVVLMPVHAFIHEKSLEKEEADLRGTGRGQLPSGQRSTMRASVSSSQWTCASAG